MKRVIEVILQIMVMRETIDRGECRVFGAKLHHQEFATGAVARVAPHPAVEAVALVQSTSKPLFTASELYLQPRSLTHAPKHPEIPVERSHF